MVPSRETALHISVGAEVGETVGENISTSLDIDYDHGRYVGFAGGRYRYGEVEGSKVTDDYRIYGGVDRYFGDPDKRKYFAMLKGFYSSDRVHLVGSQVDLFIGPGVDWKLGKRIDLTLAGGYSSEWEDFLGNTDEGVADAARIHRDKSYLYEKLDVSLADKLNLVQTGIFTVDFEDYSHFDIRLNTTLSYSLTKHLSLDLVYSFLHDDTSAETIDETISNLTIQLGYRL